MSGIPPFAALRAFECVGRLGGIRRAAAALSLDHAVVSRHLKVLEEWLGVALFDRSGKQLKLTEAGMRYHRNVSRAIAGLVSATDDIVRTEHAKVLAWCVPGFAAQWVADQVAEFEVQFPQFNVELRPTDERADLARNEADVDIRFYGDQWPPRPDGPDLLATELARPPIMAVASPGLAASLGAMNSVHDLLRAPLLHEEHDRQWRAWFEANGVEINSDLPGPVMWHAHLALAAARRGRGIALANRYLAEADLLAGDLVELTPPGCIRPVIGAYVLVSRKGKATTPGVAAFRKFLVAQAAKDPSSGQPSMQSDPAAARAKSAAFALPATSVVLAAHQG